MIRPAV